MLCDDDYYVEPITTRADVWVEVWDADGHEIAEVIKCWIDCEGCSGETPEMMGVECREVSLVGQPFRKPTELEKASIEREVELMWLNRDGLYDGEYDQISAQLEKAIQSDSPEARRERALHARAESIAGRSV